MNLAVDGQMDVAAARAQLVLAFGTVGVGVLQIVLLEHERDHVVHRVLDEIHHLIQIGALRILGIVKLFVERLFILFL